MTTPTKREFKKGDKITLEQNGAYRTFEIKWIENGIYTLHNKFQVSIQVDKEYITKNLIS